MWTNCLEYLALVFWTFAHSVQESEGIKNVDFHFQVSWKNYDPMILTVTSLCQNNLSGISCYVGGVFVYGPKDCI